MQHSPAALVPRPWSQPFFCGALAGAVQSLISSPLDNVRLVLHDAKGHWPGWLSVIKQSIFPAYYTVSTSENKSKTGRLRAMRRWGSRGYSMMALGIARDTFGFGSFFLAFESGRKLSRNARDYLRHDLHFSKWASGISQAVLLVLSGAVASLTFSAIAKPFDVARGILWEHRMDWAQRWNAYHAASDANRPPKPSTKVPGALPTLQKVIAQEGLGTLYGRGRVRHPVAGNINHASNFADAVELNPQQIVRASRRFVETSTVRTRLVSLAPYSAAFLMWAALYGDFSDRVAIEDAPV